MVEPDDVYYRFGGAAIAEMLHNRYKKIGQVETDETENGNGKLKRKPETESGNGKAEIWKWSSYIQ